MLTYAGLKQHILLALGGQPSVVTGVTRDQRIAEIINQSGNYLVSKPWRFRERTARPVTLTAGKNYAPLPADAEEIISLTSIAGMGWRVELTSPEQIELMRATGDLSGSSGVYSAAMSRPWAQSNDTTPLVDGSGMPAVRLDLFPTPQATTSDALIIRYRSAWVAISDQTADTYQIPVPAYVEALLIAYARAFGLAYEDEGLSARLIEIDNGPLFNNAAIKDGIQQRDFGRLLSSRVSPFRRGSDLVSTGFGGVGLAPATAFSNIRWRGLYSGVDAYTIGDVVRYNGTVWICVTGVTGVDPPASQWEVMTTDGVAGPTGPTGPSAYPIDYVYGELFNFDSPIAVSSSLTWFTGCEINLTTGTWFVVGNVVVTGSAGQPNFDARLFGVSTSQTFATSSTTLTRATAYASMTVSGFVVVAISSLKVRVQVAASSATTSIIGSSGVMGADDCTNLSAVRLA